MNNTIRGIFFDLYGTILIFNNIEQSWKDWAVRYYNFLKPKTDLSFEDFSKSCDGLFNRKIVKSPDSGLTTYETRLNNHCKELSISLTPAELKQVADETPHAWQKYITIPEGTLQTLKKLKENYVLALITNYDHAPHIRYTLKNFDLENIFDQIIISDEVGCAKPDQSIFRIALQKTNLKSGEVIFVGDNLKDDIAGSQSAGITPVFIKHKTFTTMHDYHHLGKQNNDIVLPNVKTIQSLEELLEF